MEGMRMSNGMKPFPIYFDDNAEPEYIYFNPADSDLPLRFMKTQKLIDEKVKEIKPYKVDENGVPDADSCIKYFDEINKAVFEALDYAFGSNVSEVVFKHCGPFSVVNGNYQILNFLKGIAPEIEKITKKGRKLADTNMNKYLAKYMKR